MPMTFTGYTQTPSVLLDSVTSIILPNQNPNYEPWQELSGTVGILSTSRRRSPAKWCCNQSKINILTILFYTLIIFSIKIQKNHCIKNCAENWH